MQISYEIRKSPEKGRGLYATAAITEGTVVWQHLPGQYTVYDESTLRLALSNMSHRSAQYVLEHIHCMPEFPNFMVLVSDDGALINHSDDPTISTRTIEGYNSRANTVAEVSRALEGNHFSLVAVRNIQIGEELTMNYNLDPDGPPYYDSLCDQYGVTWDWL